MTTEREPITDEQREAVNAARAAADPPQEPLGADEQPTEEELAALETDAPA